MRRLPLFLLAISISIAASAQTAPPPQGADSQTKGEKKKADDVKQPPSLSQTVVVTATRSERALSDLPVSAVVIPEEQIRSAPVLALDDLLRTVPGVHMPLQTAVGSIVAGQHFSMHGLGGNRALVLLDGVPMHDPYYGTVEWQKVPTDTLKQIEVIRGGNASLFGNFALGGTVNMLTRPVDTNDARLDVYYGTDQTQRQAVTLDQMITPRLGVRLSHNQFDTNGFYRVPNPGPVDVLGWNDTTISGLRADYNGAGKTSGYFKANWSRINVSQGTIITFLNRAILDLAAGTQTVIGSSNLLSTSLYRQEESSTSRDSRTTGRVSEVITAETNLPSNGTGGAMEWSSQRRGAFSFFSAGVDLHEVAATENRQSFGRTGLPSQFDVVSGRQRFAGLYGQAGWHPSADLEVIGSARIDYYKNSDGSDIVTGGTSTIYPSTTTTQFDPRISFRYQLSSTSALRGAAYRAFNAPTLRDLYRNSVVGASVSLGNPYLTPETLVGAELGVEWSFTRAHLGINLYRSDVKGLQVRAAVAGQPNTFQNTNVGKSRSQGVEAMLDWQLSRSFDLDAGYTYADATIVENPVDPTLVGKLIPEVAPHIGTLGLRYHGSRGTSANLEWRVLSRSYGEPANVLAQPAHRVLDAGVSQSLRSWLDVYARVENAFDEYYFVVISAASQRTAQPRMFTGGVRMHLPGLGFGRLR